MLSVPIELQDVSKNSEDSLAVTIYAYTHKKSGP
jgi:hypothetical protein